MLLCLSDFIPIDLFGPSDSEAMLMLSKLLSRAAYLFNFSMFFVSFGRLSRSQMSAVLRPMLIMKGSFVSGSIHKIKLLSTYFKIFSSRISFFYLRISF